jgi:hypothetical protein
MEGQEPGLRAQLSAQQRRQLEYLGLTSEQKPRESGDKNSGRTVVPTTQTKKEDIHMEATTQETNRTRNEENSSHPAVDAVERNTNRMANAAEALVGRFDRQHSFKAEAIRVGATAVATGIVTGLVVVGMQALLMPDTVKVEQVVPGTPKK